MHLCKELTILNKIINELDCNPIHRITLREICKACIENDEGVKIKTVYELVGNRLGKDSTTIKSILTRTIANISPECFRKVLGIERKPMNKEFVRLLMSKVSEEDNTEE